MPETTKPPGLIVTRPQPQADDWVAALRSRGVEALPLPLLRIGALEDAGELQSAWVTLDREALVMFVSPNAVAQFFAAATVARRWPASTIAGATGPGTVAALRECGVPSACIAAPAEDAPQFDSHALWEVLRAQPWHGRRALIVRGEDGREWLADTLRAEGAEVRLMEAYRRLPPAWDAADLSTLDVALADPGHWLWLFSSSQSVSHLVDRLTASGQGAALARMRGAATHPRIVRRAREAGLAQVHEWPPSVEEIARRTLALG